MRLLWTGRFAWAWVLALTLFAATSALPTPAGAQQQSTPQASQPPSEPQKQADHHPGIAGELVKETREAAGEDQEEEHADLKHGKPVQWHARKIGWSVHGTHLLLSGLNFAIIAVVVFWAARKYVPPLLRSRNQSIQQALEEARAASQDANRRLADIENRLRQLDVEIGRMQAAAEKEADAEEIRIQKATEDEIRKVFAAGEQEIAAAGKAARRELAVHTADLALALARQQIHVDSGTDQVLVRSFASSLASQSNNDDDGGRKGGR